MLNMYLFPQLAPVFWCRREFWRWQRVDAKVSLLQSAAARGGTSNALAARPQSPRGHHRSARARSGRDRARGRPARALSFALAWVATCRCVVVASLSGTRDACDAFFVCMVDMDIDVSPYCALNRTWPSATGTMWWDFFTGRSRGAIGARIQTVVWQRLPPRALNSNSSCWRHSLWRWTNTCSESITCPTRMHSSSLWCSTATPRLARQTR